MLSALRCDVLHCAALCCAALCKAFFSLVYEELAAARAAGQPVAGSLFWMLAAGGYPDYDSFTVYKDRAPYYLQPTGVFLQQPYTAAAGAKDAEFAAFMNREEFVACLGRRSNGTAAWNDGWDATAALIKQQAAAGV